MSISYSTRDIMFYELHWDIAQDSIHLETWMNNEKLEAWEIEFFGQHKKLVKVLNEFNTKVFMGKLMWDPKDKTIRYCVSTSIFMTLFTSERNKNEYHKNLVQCLFRQACR